MTPPIRILLADDHRIVRQGLRGILEENSRMEVAGEASDGREAVRMALDKEPDVIIMDVAMPHLGGDGGHPPDFQAAPGSQSFGAEHVLG